MRRAAGDALLTMAILAMAVLTIALLAVAIPTPACDEPQATLDALGGGVARMAVGHNIVPWVSSRCGGRLQLLDVGMSGAYGGRPAAWRCELGSDGAVLRALYEDEDEAEPPPLCARCAELEPEVASPQDWHDCIEYCGHQH